MKKKLFLLLTILCCLALSVGILAACDSESGKQDDGTSATYYSDFRFARRFAGKCG